MTEVLQWLTAIALMLLGVVVILLACGVVADRYEAGLDRIDRAFELAIDRVNRTLDRVFKRRG